MEIVIFRTQSIYQVPFYKYINKLVFPKIKHYICQSFNFKLFNYESTIRTYKFGQ